MGELLSVRKIDFAFNFATTNLSAGGSTSSGDTSTTEPYELDNDSIMELAGIEVIGPVTAAGVRQKIESIKIKIDGEIVPDIVFNELTAPPYHRNTRNQLIFHDTGGLCFNLGTPLLLGGDAIDACPKIGPKETLGFEVKAPRTAENGATITENMIIRATVVEAKTKEVMDRVLRQYGTSDGNNIQQNFSVVDLSTNNTIDVTKQVPAELDSWTELNGGLAAAKPYVSNYITYAQNATATTTNSAYRFTQTGTRVLHDFMDLSWNFTKKDAIRLTHMGVMEHANLGYVRLYISGRESPGNDWLIANDTENMFPMPLSSDATTYHFHGPAAFPRAEMVYNQQAWLEVKDNGTAVPAWADGVSGTMVALWGKRFKLRSE